MSKQLLNKLELANKTIPINSIFFHYKGGSYRVTELVINESTQNVMVVYMPLYGVSIKFTRPVEEWYENCIYTNKNDEFETTYLSPRFRRLH